MSPGPTLEPALSARLAGRIAAVAALAPSLLVPLSPVAFAAVPHRPDPVRGHIRADRAVRPALTVFADVPRLGMEPPVARPVEAVARVVSIPAPPQPVPTLEVVRVPKHRQREQVPRVRSAQHYTAQHSYGGSISAVISFALAQVGDPYVFGATGPNSWDCSSLVQAAFRAAGVLLPRQAEDISTRGRYVPRSQWRPGDILAYGYHVAIYLGSGMMVEAPHSGADVRVVPVWGSPEGRRML